jgi:hypothetical protein
MMTLACSIFDPQSEHGALVGWLLLYNNQNRIEASIASVLKQKGYRASPVKKADFLVAFHIVLRQGE